MSSVIVTEVNGCRTSAPDCHAGRIRWEARRGDRAGQRFAMAPDGLGSHLAPRFDVEDQAVTVPQLSRDEVTLRRRELRLLKAASTTPRIVARMSQLVTMLAEYDRTTH